MPLGKKSKTTEVVSEIAPLLVSLSRPVTIKPYHHKPYRLRHVGWLLLSVVALFVLTFQTGLLIGTRRNAAPAVVPTEQETPNTKLSIDSSYGFKLAFNTDEFAATASTVDANNNVTTVEQDQLENTKKLSSVTVRPLRGQVPTLQAASRLVVQVGYDKSITSLKKLPANTGLSDLDIAARQLVASNPDFDVTTLDSTADTFNQVPVQRFTYRLKPKFGGGNTYAVSWIGIANDRPFAVRLQGLVGSANVPTEYQELLGNITIDASQKVAGVSTIFNPHAAAEARKVFDDKYKSDLVSPAVVKIYHLSCGVLTITGQPITNDSCNASSGSGFLVSSDGYIATNGHVVIYTAKDSFAELLLKNPTLFESFLRAAGLSNSQINTVASRPDMQASILAKIYDLSDEDITLSNQKEATFVAIGSEPLGLSSSTDVRNAIDHAENGSIKKATIVGTNYNSKDLYTLMSNTNDGFSSSDVALLKINVKNAPVIALNTSQVTQSQKISILGFPGDAENQLVSRDSLSVSVTNGSVSSIREAAGNTGKLFQSDADASHGNSGGPALDETDVAIGLLTYRFASGDASNATKSYIRDIGDFIKLAHKNHVTFQTKSSTQTAWQKGLELMAGNHYSAASTEFEKVKQAYPAHRLVASYIASANKAVESGKDVKSMPLWLLVVGIIASLVALASAIVLIVQHHAKHQLYKVIGPTPSVQVVKKNPKPKKPTTRKKQAVQVQ